MFSEFMFIKMPVDVRFETFFHYFSFKGAAFLLNFAL